MRFRPRYSLLTLLILTALVASGVKLWYGPHRVVERPKEDEEDEYTYTNDLFSQRVLDGVRIQRVFFADQEPSLVYVTYFRAGQPLELLYFLAVDSADEPQFSFLHVLNDSPLEVAEQTAISQVIDREREGFRVTNPKHVLSEGYWPSHGTRTLPAAQ